MIDGIVWFFSGLGLAVYNLFYAVTHPGLWLNWTDSEANQPEAVHLGDLLRL